MVKKVAPLPQFVNLSPEDRMKAAKPFLDQLDQEYMNPRAQLVISRDSLFKTGQEYGIAKFRKVPPAAMGFHPRNRSSTGIVPSESHTKLPKFVTGGFSLTECAGASSVQRNPTKIGDMYEDINREKAVDSGGLLPPVAPNSLESFTMTRNHTYSSLRIAHFGVKSTDDVISHNGYISKAKIIERCPSLEDPIANGIETLEFCWQFECMYPNLVDMVIEADNVPAQAAAVDTSTTILAKTYNLAKQEKDFALVELKLIRAMPGQNVSPYVAYMKGGFLGPKEDPWVLRELEHFCNALSIIRPMNLATLAKLVELDLGPPIGAGTAWRMACLKAMSDAPERYMIGSENTACSLADVAKMGAPSTKQLVMQSDMYMRDCRVLVDIMLRQGNLLAETSVQIKVLRDTMDLQLFAHVLSKQYPHGTFTSCMQIASTFYTEASQLVGKKDMPAMPKGWKLIRKGTTTESLQMSITAADNIGGVSASGATKEQVLKDLSSRGVIVGAIAMSKIDNKLSYTIKAVREGSVVLELDGATLAVKIGELFSTYLVKHKIVEESYALNCPHATFTTTKLCNNAICKNEILQNEILQIICLFFLQVVFLFISFRTVEGAHRQVGLHLRAQCYDAR